MAPLQSAAPPQAPSARIRGRSAAAESWQELRIEARSFDFDSALVVQDTREDYGEDRFIALGLIGDRLHVVAYTMRGDKLRLISFRKANAREIERYEQAQS